MIQIVSQTEINRKKWDECVRNGNPNLPYAYSWYLDIVSPEWSGCIKGNYEAVMPLPDKTKAGIRYSFQPPFSQQLGIWSCEELDEATVDAFIKAIAGRYHLIDLHWHHQMPQVTDHNLHWETRPNYMLSLLNGQDVMRDQYNSNRKRDLKKAAQNGLQVSLDLRAEDLITAYRTYIGKGIGRDNEGTLLRLIQEAKQRGIGFTLAIRDREDQLHAGGFFLEDEGRLINLLPVTTTRGRQSGAGTLLFHHVIEQNAGSNKVLDFEGSMIPSIAQFYLSFGAINQPYWRIHRNVLIWPMQMAYQLYKKLTKG